MQIILKKQVETLAIPKRLTTTIHEIWDMQFRLKRRFGKRAFLLVTNKRFRAGYDFLLLRTLIEPELTELADWWTVFQDAELLEQQKMVQILEKSRNNTPKKA